MKLIPLSNSRKLKNQGKYLAQVDDADYEWLIEYKWFVAVCKNTCYAYRTISKDGRKTTISMHRFILGITDPNVEVDHADHNGLNNQKYNLREATHGQNKANCKATGKSEYLGVVLTKRKYKNKEYMYWKASINGNKYLGSFPYTKDGEILAAKAYDLAAREMHGKFANLNFK